MVNLRAVGKPSWNLLCDALSVPKVVVVLCVCIMGPWGITQKKKITKNMHHGWWTAGAYQNSH